MPVHKKIFSQALTLMLCLTEDEQYNLFDQEFVISQEDLQGVLPYSSASRSSTQNINDHLQAQADGHLDACAEQGLSVLVSRQSRSPGLRPCQPVPSKQDCVSITTAPPLSPSLDGNDDQDSPSSCSFAGGGMQHQHPEALSIA